MIKMLHEIMPYHFDNSYKNLKPSDNSYVIFFRDDSVSVKLRDGKLELPMYKSCSHECNYIYLFSINETAFFLADTEKVTLNSPAYDGYDFIGIKQLRGLTPKHLSFAAATACQLAKWYRDNSFCGRCGKKTKLSEKERALLCDDCKNIIYPKISPAVIVGIISGDKILVSKYAANPNNNHYALIAGFAEIGEPIEDTVRREIMEEVGLKVKNIRYYKSQPWAFSDTMLLGFFCEVDGNDEITLDKNELALAKWLSRDELPEESTEVSLTNDMMMLFKKGNV